MKHSIANTQIEVFVLRPKNPNAIGIGSMANVKIKNKGAKK